MSHITVLLSEIEAGDPLAGERLLPLVYHELRRLARSKLQHESPGHTLQPTALVHEAYLRLVGDESPAESGPLWNSQGHFFAAAAEAMRRILVEAARRKGRLKHGGDATRVEFAEDLVVAPEPDTELLALDEALTRLATVDPAAARLVSLRYFAGLTLAEAARHMHLPPRSADRLWAYAKAWLHREVRGEDSDAVQRE